VGRGLQASVVPMYEATRHSFATIALKEGARFDGSRQFLGRRDPRTTERYAKLSEIALVRVRGPRKRSPE
jgi:site-specific recombinase XerD